jgi:hypothetical protein
MRIALLVLVLGCGGGSKKAEAPKSAEASCAAVAEGMVGMMMEGKEQTPKAKEAMAGFTEIIRTRCDADAWSAEARQCLAAMKTREDAERCSNMLTEEQQANLVRDEKAKYGEGTPAPEENRAAEPPAQAPAETPKKAKGSPKPGDPCDGGE